MSGLSILIAAISAAGIVFINRCEKNIRVESARIKREAERAAENIVFDKLMRDRIAWERLINEPVGVHTPIIEKKPLRKATGLFSDEAAQEVVKQKICRIGVRQTQCKFV